MQTLPSIKGGGGEKQTGRSTYPTRLFCCFFFKRKKNLKVLDDYSIPPFGSFVRSFHHLSCCSFERYPSQKIKRSTQHNAEKTRETI